MSWLSCNQRDFALGGNRDTRSGLINGARQDSGQLETIGEAGGVAGNRRWATAKQPPGNKGNKQAREQTQEPVNAGKRTAVGRTGSQTGHPNKRTTRTSRSPWRAMSKAGQESHKKGGLSPVATIRRANYGSSTILTAPDWGSFISSSAARASASGMRWVIIAATSTCPPWSTSSARGNMRVLFLEP